jgi:hypothetical protein
MPLSGALVDGSEEQSMTDETRHSPAPTVSHVKALEQINQIRNSIIGTQTMNWSEHIYPLVAALQDAGFEGMHYPEAREYYGTLVERAVKAEDALGEIKNIALSVQPADVPKQLAHIVRLCIDALKHDKQLTAYQRPEGEQ